MNGCAGDEGNAAESEFSRKVRLTGCRSRRTGGRVSQRPPRTMTSRIYHFLLVALFAGSHLLVQPLAAMRTCGDGVAASSSCCCGEPVSPPDGCCGESQGDHGDSDSAEHECGCSELPGGPFVPPLAEPTGVEFESLSTDILLARDASPLSSAWPSLECRAARPPNRPPHARHEVGSVFTQAYRL